MPGARRSRFGAPPPWPASAWNRYTCQVFRAHATRSGAKARRPCTPARPAAMLRAPASAPNAPMPGRTPPLRNLAKGSTRVPMLPILVPEAGLAELYRTFLRELVERGFEGDVSTDYAQRLITATDNSVYQIVPQAVVHPKNRDDVTRVLAMVCE